MRQYHGSAALRGGIPPQEKPPRKAALPFTRIDKHVTRQLHVAKTVVPMQIVETALALRCVKAEAISQHTGCLTEVLELSSLPHVSLPDEIQSPL